MARSGIFTVRKYRGERDGKHWFQIKGETQPAMPVEGFFGEMIQPGSKVEAEETDELSTTGSKVWRINKVTKVIE